MMRSTWILAIFALLAAGASCSTLVSGGGTGDTGGGPAQGGSGGTGGRVHGGGGTGGQDMPGCPPADACLQAPAGQSCGPDATCDGTGHCLVTLAAGQYQPGALAVDATSVYWLDSSTSNPMGGVFSDGTVMKCGRDGCNQHPTTLATGQASPECLAVDGSRVYWGNGGINGFGTDGSLMMCAAGGCGSMPALLAGGIDVYRVVVDATRLYWTVPGNGSGSVWSCAIAGCLPQQIVAVDAIPVIAVNATTLAWTGYKGVWTCTPGACMPQALVSGIATHALALDATNVYFVTEDAVMKCALAGCNNQPTTLVSGLSWPAAIATDGVDVYFTVSPMGPGGAVMKCAVSGCNGNPTTIAAGPGIVSPQAIALDATGVYWTDLNAGTVMKAPFGAACSATSSSSSASSSTGGACAGGSMCSAAQDCPDPMNECVLRACLDGCCGFTPVAFGTSVAMQTPSDCHKVVCNGYGGTVTVPDDNDTPPAADDCHTAVCSNGTPGQVPKATGTPCSSGGGKVCGDTAGPTAGKCVACNTSADCGQPNQGCFSSACVTVDCSDGVKDGAETDVDCGGLCPPCADGKRCSAFTDCLPNHPCYPTGGGNGPTTCHADFCSDGFRDGFETSTDCGGPECPGCIAGGGCSQNSDCLSGFCLNAFCQ